MKVVFADAFYFVARLNRRDQHHELVLNFSRNFRARLLTTDWVFMEVADALADSECRGRVREFILHLRSTTACEIIPATREGLDRGLDLYHQHADKGWTLTECVSFAIMRERNVTETLTGDKHFEQAGFAALLKQ
jgi:predicted nucleic acid-binding protein